MNFIKVAEYIEVGDLVDIILRSDPGSYYRGKIMDKDDSCIVIGSRRYTDYDADDSKIQKVTTIIDYDDISVIRKMEDANINS